ncbi:MAG: hypothetical protein GXY58_12640 [Planctomycetaceae bacterium]|nr:hypothetical protein [Planctomycetaceae bacterium]
MGRSFAGTLGLLAFGTVIARCLLRGGNMDATLLTASWTLFAFAALGYIIGSIAERTVVEATETRFHAQWQAAESASSAAHANDASTGQPGAVT